MHRFVGLTLFAAALAAVLSAGCGASAHKPKELAMPVLEHPRGFEFGRQGHWRRLENGVRFLVLPDRRSNQVTVDVRYRVGAAEDPADLPGLAHLVEHLTFQTRDEEGRSLDQRLAAAALYNNAYTSFDETHYTARGHADQLIELLSIESARLRLRCEQIPNEVFERERDVVLSEMRQRGRSDLVARLTRAVYGDEHPYSRSVIGTSDSLERVTKKDVCDFWNEYYTPDAAIVVVAGRLDEDRTDDLIAQSFAPLAGRRRKPRAVLPSPKLGGGKREIEASIEKPRAYVVFSAPVFADRAETYDQLLRRELRATLEDIADDTDGIDNAGLFRFGGVRLPLDVAVFEGEDRKALRAALKELFKRARGLGAKIDQEDVRQVVPNLVTRLLLRSEPVGRRASFYADYAQYSRHPGFVTHAIERFAQLSARNVRARGARLLTKKKSLVVFVNPLSDTDGAGGADGARVATSRVGDEDFEYDIPDWKTSLEPGEAERSLEVPNQVRRPDEIAFTLDNGLQVTLVPELSYPLVDARLVFPVGTLDEPARAPYLAHLAAMLLSPSMELPEVSGKARYELLLALRSLNGMGGLFDSTVRERTTTFRVRGLGMYTDGLIWRLYQSTVAAGYDDDVIERYNELVDEYEEDREEIESARRTRLIKAAVFGKDHPYARAASSLAKVDVNELRGFRDWYHAGGARLIVVGRFDADVVEKQIRALFSVMSEGEPPQRSTIPPVRRRDEPGHLLFPTEDEQVSMVLAYAAAPGKRERAAARQVLVEMLRQRLGQIRERLGSTYGISVSGSYDAQGPGLLVIRGAIDDTRAKQTIEAVLSELASLRSDGADLSADFSRARRRVLSGLLLSDADTASEAAARERAVRDGLPDDYEYALAREVAALRLADVQTLVEAEFAADQQVMMLSGPRERLERVFKALGVAKPTIIK